MAQLLSVSTTLKRQYSVGFPVRLVHNTLITVDVKKDQSKSMSLFACLYAGATIPIGRIAIFLCEKINKGSDFRRYGFLWRIDGPDRDIFACIAKIPGRQDGGELPSGNGITC